MNPGGIVLVVAGLWALAQLLRGDVLGRLGMLGGTAKPASTASLGQGFVGVAAPAGASSQIDAVLRVALAQQGKPYVFAAKGPDRFDCSGLVTYVFKQALNMDLVPYSYTQATYGQAVPIGPQFVRPGDLIFTAGSGEEQFGHVGIALNSNEKIHARGTAYGVVRSPIDWGSVQAVRRLVTA